jgi:hypothetical protein
MGIISRVKCFLFGHYIPGSPFINKDGCFSIKCLKCGKVESIKPKSIDKDINYGRSTNQSSI